MKSTLPIQGEEPIQIELPLSRLRPRIDAQAVCQPGDVDVFFGHDDETPTERRFREGVAARVCRSCPVRAECLELAIRTGEQFGVWGGVGEHERRRMIRVRRKHNRTAA